MSPLPPVCVWFCLRLEDAASTYNPFYIPRSLLCLWLHPWIERFNTCCVARPGLNLTTMVVLTRPSSVLTRPSLLLGWTPPLGRAGPGATLGGRLLKDHPWDGPLGVAWKFQGANEIAPCVSIMTAKPIFYVYIFFFIFFMRSPGSWLGR